MLKVNGLWHVFSPSGNYLAIEAVDKKVVNENVEFVNNRLVIYDMQNFEEKLVYDLSQYDFAQTWVTEWTY